MPKPQFSRRPKSKESDFVGRSRLPGWIIRALRGSGVRRLSIIATMSDEQLLQIPGIGHQALRVIREEVMRIAEGALDHLPPEIRHAQDGHGNSATSR